MRLFARPIFLASCFTALAAEVEEGVVLKPSSEKEFIKRGSSKPKLVAFTTSWLDNCKSLEPTLSKWAAKFSEIEFIILDLDNFEKLFDKLKVDKLPTIVLYNQGNVAEEAQQQQFVGLQTKKIYNALKSLVKTQRKKPKG